MIVTGISTESNTLILSDGRRLSYAEFGDPAGKAVIGFHGMPGSRLMIKAFEPAAIALGARLIAPDRPGYGLSDPHPRGTLLSYPRDVLELANALGLDHFAVAGVSGGGPYALACAHELPGRLTAAGVISGIGPLRLPDSTRGMQRTNRIMFTLGRFSPAFAGFLLSRLIRSSLPTMEKHIQDGTSPTPDLSPEVFAIMAADQREAIRAGGQGLVFDMKMLWRPWGFNPPDIRAGVCLWHGEADTLAPSRLAHYLAQQIPGCQATFYPGEGHTDPLTQHGEEILAKIVGGV
jgi:pimeloyl-ACP methyl ester carboxylesterase